MGFFNDSKIYYTYERDYFDYAECPICGNYGAIVISNNKTYVECFNHWDDVINIINEEIQLELFDSQKVL